MADGAGLENQWTAMSRGFESHGLRSLQAAFRLFGFAQTILIGSNEGTQSQCQILSISF